MIFRFFLLGQILGRWVLNFRIVSICQSLVNATVDRSMGRCPKISHMAHTFHLKVLQRVSSIEGLGDGKHPPIFFKDG